MNLIVFAISSIVITVISYCTGYVYGAHYGWKKGFHEAESIVNDRLLSDMEDYDEASAN